MQTATPWLTERHGYDPTLSDSNRSTLRANPYPEVADPICRLPLPTFFYRLEAFHLGDLMRISVRRPKHRVANREFSRAVTWAPDPSRINAVLFPQTTHISGRADSMGCIRLTRDDNSPRTRLRRPPRIRWRYRPSSVGTCRNINLLPFRPEQINAHYPRTG